MRDEHECGARPRDGKDGVHVRLRFWFWTSTRSISHRRVRTQRHAGRRVKRKLRREMKGVLEAAKFEQINGT